MNITSVSIDTCPDNWGYYFSNLVAYNKPANLIIKKRKKPIKPACPHKKDKYMKLLPPEMYYIFEHLSAQQIKIIISIIELATLDDLELDNNEEFWDYIKELVKSFNNSPKPKKPHKKPHITKCDLSKTEVSVLQNVPKHVDYKFVPKAKPCLIDTCCDDDTVITHFHSPGHIIPPTYKFDYVEETEETEI